MATNINLNINFSAGAETAYAELPVAPAYVKWARGNAGLFNMKDTDPAQFLGGWRAMVLNRDGEANPTLPIKVVERVSQDGTKFYQAYAANVINFLPLQHRTRFEKREMVIDPNTGTERSQVVAVAGAFEKGSGMQPNKQVFGLVFSDDLTQFAPAVLMLDKWNTFKTFNAAEAKFAKVRVPTGKALVRKFGTIGTQDKKTGRLVPVFETYGQALSTPIEAIEISNPQLIDVTENIAELYYNSVEWSEDAKWKASTQAAAEDGLSAKSKFLARANELGLSNIDIEQLIAENGGDYRAALNAIDAANPESEDDLQF